MPVESDHPPGMSRKVFQVDDGQIVAVLKSISRSQGRADVHCPRVRGAELQTGQEFERAEDTDIQDDEMCTFRQPQILEGGVGEGEERLVCEDAQTTLVR